MLLHHTTRRAFLARLATLGGTVTVAAACSSPTPAAPTSAAGAPTAPPTAPAAPTVAPAVSPASSASAAPSAAVPSPSAQGSPAPSARAPLSPPVKVRVGVLGLNGEAGFFHAVDQGYFQAEGLDLQLVPFTISLDQVPLLTSGDLDFGGGSAEPGLLNAAARGINVKFTAVNLVVGDHDTSGGFMVRKDLIDGGQFKELKDFKGLTVALPSGRGQDVVYLERALANAGLTLDDVKTTALGFPDMITAFSTKAIDAAFEVEPLATVAAGQGVAQMVTIVSDFAAGFPGSVVIMSPKFAAANLEAARRFEIAHLRGQRDFYHAFVENDAPDLRPQIVQALINHTQVKDPALVGKMTTFKVDPNDQIDATFINQAQDTYIRLGVLNQRIDLSQVIDPSFANYAAQQLGSLN